MCPSYQALGNERHSTRGRAVLMRAALEGHLEGGLADDGLHEALELCLGCEACASEWPGQVDMTQLKTEALAHTTRARGVPLAARLAGHAHDLLAPRVARAAHRAFGRDARRRRRGRAALPRRSGAGVQNRPPRPD